MPRFCRHNRLMAECPICSRDTVLDHSRTAQKRTPARARARPERPAGGPAPKFSGPYGAVGPYEDEDGARYEVRLERVPGGLRLAEWTGGALRRRAPVLAAADVSTLNARTAGRAGELRDELRVEPLGEGRLRLGRWVLRPGAGWELRDGPVLLPVARFEEAIGHAARLGLLGAASELGAAPRP